MKNCSSFWNDIGEAKCSSTTGNVLNMFYGAITAGLANESAFEKHEIGMGREYQQDGEYQCYGKYIIALNLQMDDTLFSSFWVE